MSQFLSNRTSPSRYPRKTVAFKLYFAIVMICIIQFLPIEFESYALPVLQEQDKLLKEPRDPERQLPQSQQSNLFYPSSSQSNNAQQQQQQFTEQSPTLSTPPPSMTDSARRSQVMHPNQPQPNQILSNGLPLSPSQDMQQRTSAIPPNPAPSVSTAQPSSYIIPFNTRNSQRLNNTIRTSSKNNVPRDYDSMSEGSGNGPVPVSKQPKEKFDDTEEGDDEDDEDYDYKDSTERGSGHGSESRNKKVELLGNNLVKKPTNESDIYLPFRHPSSTASSITNHPSSIPVLSKIVPVTDTNSQGNAHQSDKNRSSYSQQSDSSGPLAIEIGTAESFSTIPPTTVQNRLTESPKSASSNTQKLTNEELRPTFSGTPSTSTLSPLNLPDNQLRMPSVFSTTFSPLYTTLKYPADIGSSSFSRPNATSKDSSDYLYEDESDDDDSEDSSIFDYNDSSENDTTHNKSSPANNASFVSTMLNRRPTQTSPKPIVSEAYVPTTAAPKPAISSTTQPIIKSILLNTINNTTNTTLSSSKYQPSESVYESSFTTTTTRAPNKVSTPPKIESLGEDDDADEDEDEEDKEDDEDDIEEETYEEEKINLNETSLISGHISSSKGIISHPPRRTSTQYPKPPSIATNFDTSDGSFKPSKSVAPPYMAQPSSPAPPSNSSISITSHPMATNPPITKPPTIATIFITTTTPIPMIITSIPSTTSTTTTPSTTTITTRRPSTVAPLTASSTTTARTTSIIYETTPRNVIFPAITKISDLNIFEKGLNDDDAGLTKQIYDKAVEVYEATSKAIQAAADSVWSPAFELNSNTFEPLLTQPLLFMLVLGASIIGLVLTMMLVVYIITYQIEPKDDISDDIY